MTSNSSDRSESDTPPRSGFDPDQFAGVTGQTHRDRHSPEEATRGAVARANAPRSHADDSRPAGDDKQLRRRMQDLSREELDRLSILQPGATLEQGAVYADLDDPARGPFQALGGETARQGQRLIAKRETDVELWNRLVRADRGTETQPAIDRPARAAHGIDNQAGLND